MVKRLLRKTLSAPALLRTARACFDEVEDPVPAWRGTTDTAAGSIP